MATTRLRRVGGSMMTSIPPALLDQLGIEAGEILEIDIEGDHLCLRRAEPRYTLEELLEQCDPNAPLEHDDEWLTPSPVGKELI